jgi:hypothetical protein
VLDASRLALNRDRHELDHELRAWVGDGEQHRPDRPNVDGEFLG